MKMPSRLSYARPDLPWNSSGQSVSYTRASWWASIADLLVEGAILIELKTVRALDGAHRAQCINDLRATWKRLCLLINFGRPRIEVQRIADDP